LICSAAPLNHDVRFAGRLPRRDHGSILAISVAACGTTTMLIEPGRGLLCHDDNGRTLYRAYVDGPAQTQPRKISAGVDRMYVIQIPLKHCSRDDRKHVGGLPQ